MKVKLNVYERSMLNALLPKEGDFDTLKSIQEARTNLLLSEAEVKEFDFKTEQIKDDKGNVTSAVNKWNEKGNEGKELEIAGPAMEAIKGVLEEMNKKKQLTSQLIPIYSRFVLGEEPA